jgi:hypothetical protein
MTWFLFVLIKQAKKVGQKRSYTTLSKKILLLVDIQIWNLSDVWWGNMQAFSNEIKSRTFSRLWPGFYLFWLNKRNTTHKIPGTSTVYWVAWFVYRTTIKLQKNESGHQPHFSPGESKKKMLIQRIQVWSIS